MKSTSNWLCFVLVALLAVACSKEDPLNPQRDNTPVKPIPGFDIVRLPVVVHILHNGEEIGEGPNLSAERILRQIEILNEDFRRKEGTRGFNNHPDGADTKIEFVLAKSNPQSEEFDGINRIVISNVQVEGLGYNQNHFAQYAYWDPQEYINIWTTPLPLEAKCLVLGTASAPFTDLPGTENLLIPQEGDAEGILINWVHFGESDMNCQAKYGRTLSHEMGHYFSLLHTWGTYECDTNDYCDDTPAVDEEVFGRSAYEGCSGEDVMIGNYMNYSDDDVMNIFTTNQAERMHYVLSNHEGRNNLMTSPALSVQ